MAPLAMHVQHNLGSTCNAYNSISLNEFGPGVPIQAESNVTRFKSLVMVQW